MSSGMLVGRLTCPAATGNQSYVVGQTPKAIIFYGSRMAAPEDGFGTECIAHFGCASSPTHRWSYFSDGNPGAHWDCRFLQNEVIRIGTDSIADIVSFDANGFTLNWSAAGPAAYVYYTVFYGDIIAKAGTLTVPSVGTTVSISGVGGQPTGLVMGWTRENAIDVNGYEGVGFSDGINNASSFNVHRDLNSSDQWSLQRSDSCGCGAGITGITDWTTKVQSFDSDGFTLAVTDNPVADITEVGYLALCGPRFGVGTETQATANGNRTKGVGFTPKGVIFSSVMKAASASTSQPAKMVVGAYDGTTFKSAGRGAGTVPNDDFRVSSNSAMFSSSTSAFTGKATGVSLDAGGFTLGWSGVDGTAYQFIYFAIGDWDSSVSFPFYTAKIRSRRTSW